MTVLERRTYSPEELEDRLAPIVSAIRSVYEPERIILYGSAGEGRPWHDLDLLIVAETPDSFFDRQEKLASVLREVGQVPSDAFVYTPRELQQQIEENRFFIVREVLGKGRTIYDKGRSKGGKRPRKAFLPAVEEYARQGVEPVTEEMAADTQSWLNYAFNDRRWATHSLEGGFYPQACFAGQQSVEKLCKAYLLARDRVPPRTHELRAHLALCAEFNPSLKRLEKEASLLDRYYMATRYPDVTLPGGRYGEKEAKEALQAATAFFDALERPIREWLAERE